MNLYIIFLPKPCMIWLFPSALTLSWDLRSSACSLSIQRFGTTEVSWILMPLMSGPVDHSWGHRGVDRRSSKRFEPFCHTRLSSLQVKGNQRSTGPRFCTYFCLRIWHLVWQHLSTFCELYKLFIAFPCGLMLLCQF